MGINPVANLNPLAVSRPTQADLEPLPMTRVENSANPSDDSYSPGEGGPAGGAEDDGAGAERDGQPEDIDAEAVPATASEKRPAFQIDLFA